MALAVTKTKSAPKIKAIVYATGRFVRVAPRKVRLVTNQLKGLSVPAAEAQLKFITRAAAHPLSKLLKSAVANALDQYQLAKDDLVIKNLTVNDGPVLKRYQPRAFGRSTMIRKRTSHIELFLTAKPGVSVEKKKRKPAAPVAEKKTLNQEEDQPVKVVSPDEVKQAAPKSSGRGPEERGRSEKGFLKKIFSRKTG